MDQLGAISEPSTSVSDHPAPLPLPLPRYLLKHGDVVDRWTGSRFRKAPSVLVGLLNSVHGDAAAEIAKQLEAGQAAQVKRQAAEIDKLRQELRDVYALVKREREACHDLANKLHTLQAVVDRAVQDRMSIEAAENDLGHPELYIRNAPDGHWTVVDRLAPHATPDNPFADPVRP